ncbi:MAG: efflux RND transporter permease subunit, partial [Planctomycetota bacterium]
MIRFAIARPVTVTVCVLLTVLFGLIGLRAIPIQLSPTVDRPVITVTTNWPGRSPQEIVDEITKEQEERLKNVSSLDTMRSLSREGAAEITLEFQLEASIDRALQEVADALRQVPDYPDEVQEPVIKAADGASDNAIAWMIIDLDPAVAEQFPDFDITTLHDFLEREFKPHLERTNGVAQINVFGGRPREVRILVDPVALAQRQLSYGEVVQALQAQNRNVSAGAIAEGKRDYRVRVLGQFEDARAILDTVVAYRDNKPVYVRDLGDVEVGYQKQRGFVRSFGQPSIAVNAIRQSGANVMEVMAELRERLVEARADIIPRADPVVGKHLRLRQVYDETVYIDSAIDLVTGNLWLGGLLAAAVLLLFLRSFVTTGVIALAIPVSVIGTFLLLLGLGRNLNVISLAGLAFSVGMIVDNAIVVLENIYRRLQAGESPERAAQGGAQEVWGAVLASTLTTICVFVPILTIGDEAGQLFRDIALAIVGAVSLSLIVSITVIPSACAAWLRKPAPRGVAGNLVQNLFGVVPLAGWLVESLARLLRWTMGGWRGVTVRPLIIALLTAASLYGAVKLAPPLDYLPAGNRNLVFGGLLIPPGYSIDQQVAVAERIESRIKPYADADITKPETVEALPPIFRMRAPDAPFAPVPVANFFRHVRWRHEPGPRGRDPDRGAGDPGHERDPGCVRRSPPEFDLRARGRGRELDRPRGLRKRAGAGNRRGKLHVHGRGEDLWLRIRPAEPRQLQPGAARVSPGPERPRPRARAHHSAGSRRNPRPGGWSVRRRNAAVRRGSRHRLSAAGR